MRTNLFPAVLLAGPPHSGKSVLSFMLSQHLRNMGIAHYLLRAVPDGEGDWFLEGDPNIVRPLRLANKGDYTVDFVGHMRDVVESRLLPLLVDIGGRPRDEQFDILRACTHSVVLYRTEEERLDWQEKLAGMDLLPVAELRSSLNEEDRIEQVRPILQGVTTGLERETDKRKTGAVFGALLDRVAGICHYEEAFLEKIHTQRAPLPFMSESELARRLGLVRQDKKIFWSPADLRNLQQVLAKDEPLALYGRGPVWLAAFAAAHTCPVDMAMFDVRFGWVKIPKIGFADNPSLQTNLTTLDNIGDLLTVSIPGGVLEPDQMTINPFTGKNGLTLSGRLPRWTYAALARQLLPLRAWIGIHEPKQNQIVVIHSNTPSMSVGDVLPIGQ